jgi:hypothetical protein
MTDIVEEMAVAIWREDHYDPKLCGHGGEGGSACAYCEPHDDDTPDDWPADKERAERQARAAYTIVERRIGELTEALERIAQPVFVAEPAGTPDSAWFVALSERIEIARASLEQRSDQ